jgi:hypothetical protein
MTTDFTTIRFYTTLLKNIKPSKLLVVCGEWLKLATVCLNKIKLVLLALGSSKNLSWAPKTYGWRSSGGDIRLSTHQWIMNCFEYQVRTFRVEVFAHHVLTQSLSSPQKKDRKSPSCLILFWFSQSQDGQGVWEQAKRLCKSTYLQTTRVLSQRSI